MTVRQFFRSKTIANHPGVADYCDSGEDETPHDVLLKEGWHFRALDGDAKRHDWDHRMTGLFATVRDFLDADPVKHQD